MPRFLAVFSVSKDDGRLGYASFGVDTNEEMLSWNEVKRLQDSCVSHQVNSAVLINLIPLREE